VGTIALLGGSGFVGTRAAAALASGGSGLRILTRRPAHADHLRVLPQLRVATADPSDQASLARALAGCSAVVNFIGILNERGRDGSGFRRAHVGVATALVEACRRAGVPKLVQVSALNAGHPQATSHYLRSKGEAEAILLRSGLAVTILQPSVIFGPGDSFLNRFARLLRLMPGIFPLAMADARFAPVHVDDVAAAIATVVARDDWDGATLQLCGPEQFTLGEIVALTARTLDLPRAVLPLPRWLARLQAAVMDFVPGKPFSTDNYRSLLLPSVCSTSGFAALGLQPRSLTAGIAMALGVAGPLRDYDRFRQAARR
jgi:NADH dehydrogenase